MNIRYTRYLSANLLTVVMALLVLAGCGQSMTEQESGAPLLGASKNATGEDATYIVVFKEDTRDAPGLAKTLAAGHGGQLKHTYEHALKGFAARLNPRAVEALQHNPNVAYIEPDGIVTASATQSNATWGLDRIDQNALPLSKTYSYTNTGAGVNAYVVDTGIRLTHAEFGNRAISGFDAIDGGAADDCNGHGTHVAGTVGGTTYGVAKGVNLVAVRVLDCAGSGTNSGVIAGVDWVTANHVKPAVANMSLGGGASAALDDAVARATAKGVTFVVAAGNGNQAGIGQDACRYSPARAPSAITVGATDSRDRKAGYSNYGTCVDIFAPGSGITSAWYTGNTALSTISGTSMASPHVAGVAALYLQSNSSASPATVTSALLAGATLNVVAQAKTTNAKLLFTAY